MGFGSGPSSWRNPAQHSPKAWCETGTGASLRLLVSFPSATVTTSILFLKEWILCCPPASMQGFRDKALWRPQSAVVGGTGWRWGHLPSNSSPDRSAAAWCTWSFNWPMCSLDSSLFIIVIIMQSDTTYLQNMLEMHYLYRNYVHRDPFSPWWLQIMWKALLWFISRAKDIVRIIWYNSQHFKMHIFS